MGGGRAQCRRHAGGAGAPRRRNQRHRRAGTGDRPAHAARRAHLACRRGGASDRTLRIAGATLHEGDLLTLDGNEGTVHAGAVRVEVDYPEELLARLEALRRSATVTPA
jgi:hypothetical protein